MTNTVTKAFKGDWWHPSNPDKVVHGTLTIGSPRGPLLELDGMLAERGSHPWPDTVERFAPAIHGHADGNYVTIFEAYAPRTIMKHGVLPSEEQDLRSEAGALIGGNRHLTSIDEPIFRVLEVELDYLTFWSNMSESEYEESSTKMETPVKLPSQQRTPRLFQVARESLLSS
ncbi:hypothetical protein I1A62_00235 (plasmid) [Rhodococcus sp. USK10]|uniref:ApeA N-terminal domain 1-containing protein n=1 Tax=Rhodococcus sp. USK10 TaxID=2789739 RepID=UPI001C5EE11C|nr:hypothetical protein [Rhodococcus sp. USK10]QYA99691.1 hypothetical protein I1A62_00235 [Rhodococcus sp. USK10]